MVDASKYAVIDLETNGVESKTDDLLSISLYRPDIDLCKEIYLPLTKNDTVLTTDMNGITQEMLRGKKHLTQQDVDCIIKDFDLTHRTLLMYSTLDERFMKRYFKEHKLNGIENFHFYNFKDRIISNKEYHASKDHICEDIGIEGVEETHNGLNDCKLEWKLFEKMDEKLLLIDYIGNIYSITDDAFCFSTWYLNNCYHISKYLMIKKPKMTLEVVKEFKVPLSKFLYFEPNEMGQIMENIVNFKVQAISKREESINIQKENKRRLKLLSIHPHYPDFSEAFPIDENGIITTDLGLLKRMKFNKMVKEIEKNMDELVSYIQTEIFLNQPIYSQDIAINQEEHIQARCDLSNEHAVMEIKTTSHSLERYAQQLYYQSMNRKCYFLRINMDDAAFNEITYTIYQATFK